MPCQGRLSFRCGGCQERSRHAFGVRGLCAFAWGSVGARGTHCGDCNEFNSPGALNSGQDEIIIRPVPPASLTLDELLRGVTDENLHGEWQTGPAVGREAW